MASLVLAIQMKSKVEGVWSGGQPGMPMSSFMPVVEPALVLPEVLVESTPMVVPVLALPVLVPGSAVVPVVGVEVSLAPPVPSVADDMPPVATPVEPVPEAEVVGDVAVMPWVALTVPPPSSPHDAALATRRRPHPRRRT